MARFTRESACLGPVAENRQVENVAVGVREHSQQVAIVVRLLWICRVQHSVVFEGQITQTEVYSDQGDNPQVSRLDQTHDRKWSFDLYGSADPDCLAI